MRYLGGLSCWGTRRPNRIWGIWLTSSTHCWTGVNGSFRSLNRRFLSHKGHRQIARSAFVRQKGALPHFSSTLEWLTTFVGVTGGHGHDLALDRYGKLKS